MNYIAQNLTTRSCEAIDICRDCVGPAPAQIGDISTCKAVDHKKYYVSEIFHVVGPDQMKAELVHGGPISCSIHATEEFDNYDGTYIYSEKTDYTTTNHTIAVVGYGKDAETGQEYWIGRNSWGTYWADWGFFYMAMYEDNLLIETNCVAGTPSYEKPHNPNTEVFIQ